MTGIRAAAVADLFYPKQRTALLAQIDPWLAQPSLISSAEQTNLLIVPHAGYRYSGATAAAAYRCLQGRSFRRVLVAAPNHRVPLQGMALSSATAFATTLGQMKIDREGCQRLTQCAGITVNDLAHKNEHAIEVQLPFLQRLLPQAELLPLIIGQTPAKQVAQLFSQLWQPDTLFIISTDLSHYLSYQQAQRLDRQTVQQLIDNRGPISAKQACGSQLLNGLIHFASQHSLQAKRLAQCNSGDITGDKTKVVGYASLALF